MQFLDEFRRSYKPAIQLSPFQAQAVGGAIRSRAPGCNLLVFGLGNDTDLWLALNADGRCHFLEGSTKWIAAVQERLGALPVSVMPTFGLNVAKSMTMSESDLAAFPIPPEIADVAWDVILVDGPAGYGEMAPGRAVAISWASRLASRHTHVFVDDYERTLEGHFADLLLRNRRGTASYVLPAADHTFYRQLFWSAGDPIAQAPAPQMVVLAVTTPADAKRFRMRLDNQVRYCRRYGYRHRVVEAAQISSDLAAAKWQAAVPLLREGRDVLLLDAGADMDASSPAAAEILEQMPDRDVFVMRDGSGNPRPGIFILRGGANSAAVAALTGNENASDALASLAQ